MCVALSRSEITIFNQISCNISYIGILILYFEDLQKLIANSRFIIKKFILQIVFPTVAKLF